MTTVEQVWEEAGRRGIELKLDGEHLRVRADRGALTTEFADALRRHKPELIERLRKLAPGQRAVPLLRVPRDQDTPLSLGQEQLWLVNEIAGDGSAYNVAAALRFSGAIDEALLEKALECVIARHEALRTHFATLDGRVVQRVLPSTQLRLNRSYFDALHEPERSEAVQAQIREDTRQRFDLEATPPVSWRWSRLGPCDHVLSVVLHHIIGDAWSVRIMFSEVTTAYCELAAGRTPSFPELPLQYVDYAAWQRQSVTPLALRNDLDFWRDELEGIPPLLELPADRMRDAREGRLAGRVVFELSGELPSALRGLAQDLQTTSFTVLLTMYALLLARLSGEDDVVVGAPTVTRDDDRLQGVLGYFVNTLAFRIKADAADSCTGLIAQSRASVLRCFAHRSVPFQQVVQELNPPRSSAHNPIYQVLFTYLPNLASLNVVRDGLQVGMFDVDSAMSRFDLNLMLEERDGALRCVFEYDQGLFDAETVQRWAEQYERLLRGCVQNREADPWRLALVRPGLEREARSAARGLAADRDEDVLLRFEENVRKLPERLALRSGNEALTYAELGRRSGELAAVLHERGVRPGECVGVCVPRGAGGIVALLGVMMAGATYVPLDAAFPSARLRGMQAAAKLKFLVAAPETAGLAAELGLASVQIDERPRADAPNLYAQRPGTRPAYVLFTSGSEGQPKGVVMPHRALANLISWQLRTAPVAVGEVVAAFAPVTFDVSIQEAFTALCGGGQLAIFSEEERRDPHAALAALQRYEVSRLHLPFVALQQLATAFTRRSARLPALRHVISAGEALRITPALRAFFATHAQCRLHNQYGPTETHVITEHILPPEVEHWPDLPAIGTAIDNVEIHLLDRRQEPVPTGVAGEIFAAGVCLADGYLPGVDEASAARFTVLPDGVRAYRTGDLARRDSQGNLRFLRRRDSQVKIRGYRVELLEVERALSDLDGVDDVAVIVHAPESGEARLVAYVVLDSSRNDPMALRAELSRSLPDYMLPSVIVALPELPRTASNKLARSRLPAPEVSADTLEQHDLAASSPWQQRLAALWCELLELQTAPIDVSFFDLGGHSLLATRLSDRLSEELGVEVPVRVIFDHPSIRALEEWIAQRSPAEVGEMGEV